MPVKIEYLFFQRPDFYPWEMLPDPGKKSKDN